MTRRSILEIGYGNNPRSPNVDDTIYLEKDEPDLFDVIRRHDTPLKWKSYRMFVTWDLEKTPLPFSNNRFKLIIASHVLEHILNLDSLMLELHRILEPKGKLLIWLPHYSYDRGAQEDPDHKWIVTYAYLENLESYFKIVKAEATPYGSNKFRRRRGKYLRNPRLRTFVYDYVLSWFLPPRECHFILEKI